MKLPPGKRTEAMRIGRGLMIATAFGVTFWALVTLGVLHLIGAR